MQFKQSLLRLILILIPFSTFSQTTFLLGGDKANLLYERLEIKSRKDSFFNFSKDKPFSRKMLVGAIDHFCANGGKLTRVDAYNMQRFYLNNLEWVPEADRSKYLSKKTITKNFYKTPANLYEVHIKDFDLIVNPVFQYTLSKESNSDEKLFLNTRGVTIRGKITNKIGFYSYITDNQERDPSYVRQWVAHRRAVPGNGFYKNFKGAGYDFFDARGYLTFNVAKYIDVVFGYDKNFIGNGHRSLLLSDFSSNNLFLKLNTRIWKVNYQNLFMELQMGTPQFTGMQLISKKYAAMHHLDIGVTKWLNIGLFEGLIFGRKDHFDFSYLNPILFYRSIEHQNGSFDNSIIGLDFKTNLPHRIQVYGQLMLDEFLLAEVKKNSGWWANKWGTQLGAKYIDAFAISNLDLQLELNSVRPFAYSHYDSIANYTHYNQPLAHPLMAGFKEFIGILRYQPVPKLMILGKMIYYQQGRDSSSRNFGSNIFLPNSPPYRVGEYGYSIGSGWNTKVFYGSLAISYELRESLNIDVSGLFRKEETTTVPLSSKNILVLTVGLRWNMARREFDY